jgi:hypothetical protein
VGCVRPALQVGVRRRRHLNQSAVASANEYESLTGCDQVGKEESGSSLPLSGTLALPSDRPAGAPQLHSTNTLPPSTAGCVGHGYGYVHTQPISSPGLASAVNWFMRSPPQPLGRLAFVPGGAKRMDDTPHRRAKAVCAADIACRACCRELSRLTWCSPPADTACHLHAPCSGACRRF